MRAHADVRSRDHADVRSYFAPSCDLPLDSGEVARLLWTHTTGNDVVKQSEGVSSVRQSFHVAPYFLGQQDYGSKIYYARDLISP